MAKCKLFWRQRNFKNKKYTTSRGETVEANVEGSGWFACPAPIWPSFDKIALVEL